MWLALKRVRGWPKTPSARRAAHLRVLDKLTGKITDLDLSAGESQSVGRLTVGLEECRYPADNPTADAFAHMIITDTSATKPVFSGWMLASSPALSALDNARYDVWVLGCILPDGVAPDLSVEEDPAATEDAAGE